MKNHIDLCMRCSDLLVGDLLSGGHFGGRDVLADFGSNSLIVTFCLKARSDGCL